MNRRRTARIVILVILALGVYALWRTIFTAPPLPPNVLALSGRIEGDESAISPKASGRIIKICFREGDSVHVGDIVAVLSDDQVMAREDQARAAVAVAEARSRFAAAQIPVLEQQLFQSRLQTEQSKLEVAGRMRQAEAELAAAQADLARQEASYELALFNERAYTNLASRDEASQQQAKEATANAAQIAAAVAAARRRVVAAEGVVTTARADLQTPDIRLAQAETIQRQIAQQKAEVASAKASEAQARGQLLEAEANRQDLIVRAPFDAVVATRSAEPGEIVNAGTPIVTIVDLTKVYLRGFVPEGQIGKVKLYQPARVYLDSDPTHPLDAYIARIDPQATFTPENTYFRNERVKQVVGLKVQLKSGFGFAKPGMPADGEILIGGDQWPKSYRRK